MSEKELTEAALAENIFRITHWNWLKPKKSKIIVTVFDFQKKNNDVQSKIFECFLLKLLKSSLFQNLLAEKFFALGS